jgi:hypothetical protein
LSAGFVSFLSTVGAFFAWLVSRQKQAFAL